MSAIPEPPPSTTRPPSRRDLALGIGLTVCSGVLIACMDGISKHLNDVYPVVQIVWGRYLFHTIIVGAVLALRRDPMIFVSRTPVVQVCRAMALAAATALLYTALTVVPLADSTAVQFFAPVLVTLLAGLVLREHVSRRSIACVVAGFVGVLIVIQPNLNTSPYMLLPLGAAILLAFYYLLTRLVSRVDRPATTLFYTTVVGAVLASMALPLVWQAPDLNGWLWMIGMGALGAIGHLALVCAFAYAPASALAPFLYSQLLTAALLSVTVFGDPIRLSMVAGTALIVFSGLYVALSPRPLAAISRRSRRLR